MANERTILLVGRTDKGRSTLANVISNTNNFKESEYGVSESEGAQIGHFFKEQFGIRKSNRMQMAMIILFLN